MRLAALYRYPVKSLGGESLPAAAPAVRGLVGDRRWMFVDGAGRFISQRSQPQLARYRVSLVGEHRLRFYRKADGLHLADVEGAGPREPGRGSKTPVSVWDDRLAATAVESPALPGLLRELGLPRARLVVMQATDRRPVDPAYAGPRDEVSFADGFPYLVTTTASLAALNARLDEPVSMLRFRPNLVIEQDAPFAEDDWGRVRIGGHLFALPKPCARCVVVNGDPATGERTPDVLNVLADFRRAGRKLLFGMNALWAGGAGNLRVGDAVQLV